MCPNWKSIALCNKLQLSFEALVVCGFSQSPVSEPCRQVRFKHRKRAPPVHGSLRVFPTPCHLRAHLGTYRLEGEVPIWVGWLMKKNWTKRRELSDDVINSETKCGLIRR